MRRAGLGRARALPALVLPLLLTACLAPAPASSDFALAPRLTNPDMPLSARASADLRESTDAVCGAVPCIEAWDSAAARYLRFATIPEAADHAAAVADATVDRFVVIDFSALPTSQPIRDEIEATVLVQLPPEHAPWGLP